MYGALTGKSKQMIANEYGEDQLKVSIRLNQPCKKHTCIKLMIASARLHPTPYMYAKEMASRVQDPAS